MPKSFKSLSVILAILTLLTSWPQSLPVSASSTNQEISENYTDRPSEKPGDIIGELNDLRTLNTKYYFRDDNTVSAAIYPETVHYAAPDGTLLDIDNSLSYSTDSSGNSVYINKAKNYDWSKYKYLNSVINSFTQQATRYMQLIGSKVNGQGPTISSIEFYFSSKPPQQVIDALKQIGVSVNWVGK